MSSPNITLLVRENLPSALDELYVSRNELVRKLIEVSQQIAMLELYKEVDDQSKRVGSSAGPSRESPSD